MLTQVSRTKRNYNGVITRRDEELQRLGTCLISFTLEQQRCTINHC